MANLFRAITQHGLQVQKVDVIYIEVVAEGLQADRRREGCCHLLPEELQETQRAACEEVERLAVFIGQSLRQLLANPSVGRGKQSRGHREGLAPAQFRTDEGPDASTDSVVHLQARSLLRQCWARAIDVGERRVQRTQEAEDHRARDDTVGKHDRQGLRPRSDRTMKQRVECHGDQQKGLPPKCVAQAPENRIDEQLQHRSARRHEAHHLCRCGRVPILHGED
mmetsp:Transcript_4276/g.11948  ORF Transcript_4276/g.11948 Transcript_4276/m.11948 type:complete len:223 (-) Transcript_4276:207-875(-)